VTRRSPGGTLRPLALALLLLPVAPALVTAQSDAVPYDQAIRASAALARAARQSLSTAALHAPVAEGVLAARRTTKRSEGVTLMIIGGAAVLVGAIAGGGGGTALIVGGVVCAGYGFYLYTQ
jgi:hypothetical protein